MQGSFCWTVTHNISAGRLDWGTAIPYRFCAQVLIIAILSSPDKPLLPAICLYAYRVARALGILPCYFVEWGGQPMLRIVPLAFFQQEGDNAILPEPQAPIDGVGKVLLAVGQWEVSIRHWASNSAKLCR